MTQEQDAQMREVLARECLIAHVGKNRLTAFGEANILAAMSAYAQTREREAYEAAARVADQTACLDFSDRDEGYNAACQDIAAAIRALYQKDQAT